MNIINNLSGDSHFQQIIELSKNADTFYIISPFLTKDFDELLSEFKDAGVKHIHLVTKLKDNDPDLLGKADSLYSFCVFCQQNDMRYDVYADNDLHGKIYLASKNGAFTGGILSSANFTGSGLRHNHEWGVWINDLEVLKALHVQVFSVCSNPLKLNDIESLIKRIDEYNNQNQKPESVKIDLSVKDLIKHKAIETSEEYDSDINYFIKPLGTKDSPFPLTATMNSEIDTIGFSIRKPRSVHEGDIIICYGVGKDSRRIIGYFKVLNEPVHSGDYNERFPWSVQGKNLCPAYSENWSKYNLTVSSLTDSYDMKEPVTYVGTNTLGALRYGSDKIQLHTRFANHVIKLIEAQIANLSSEDEQTEGASSPNVDLEQKLYDELIVNTKECQKLGYNPTAFLEMLSKYGTLGTARKLIHAPHVSDGYSKLFMMGRLDLTLEAVMLKPEYANLLTKEELEICASRIQ